MPDETPAGYRPAGTVTVTIRFASGPHPVRGLVLEHEACGRLVTVDGISGHQCDDPLEAAEEGR